MPLDKLPICILQSIFDYLSHKELLSLSHTNGALSKAASPILYREMRCHATKSRSYERKLALLVRTLLEKPQYAGHIKSLSLLGDYECWTIHTLYDESGNYSDHAGAWGLHRCTFLSGTQIALASNKLSSHLDATTHISVKDTLIALLLLHCNSLQTLAIGNGFQKYSVLLPHILKRMSYILPRLQIIKLGIEQPSSKKTIHYVDLSLIRPIFELSKVITFECMMTEPFHFAWTTSNVPQNRFMTTLRLVRTNISRSTLAQLLSTTQHLRVLRYEQELEYYQSSRHSFPFTSYLDLSELNAALSQVQYTLEECALVVRLAPGSTSPSQYDTHGPEFPIINGALSLANMKHLKKIEVPIFMLVGWSHKPSSQLADVLPHSVSAITFRDDLVPYCPWLVRGSRGSSRIGRVGRYVLSQQHLAPELQTLKIRLTSAKDHLRNAVTNLQLLTDTKDIKTSITLGTKSETYTWKFKDIDAHTGQPRDDERADITILPESV